MILIFILTIAYVEQCSSQSLVATHFIADKTLGFKSLEFKYISLTHTSGDLETTESSLKTYLASLKGFFSAAKWTTTHKVIEPIRGQTNLLITLITDILATIEHINAIANKVINRSKRAVDNNCNVVSSTNITMIEANLVGLSNLILKAKAMIDADAAGTVVAFIASDKFYQISHLLTDSHMLATEMNTELSKTHTKLIHLMQNKFDPFTKHELRNVLCLKEDIEIIQSYTIEDCNQLNRQIQCSAQLILGKQPTTIYHMRPYRFDSCFIDKQIFIDGQYNLYNLNEHGMLVTSADDLCIQSVVNLNSTSIRKHCPFKREQKHYEFGYKSIVIHELTDVITQSLKNESIKVIRTPFMIVEGVYKITLGDTEFKIRHEKEVRIETPNLPFPRSILCPRPSITSFFSYSYFEVHWPAFFVNGMALTLLIGTLICLGKLCKKQFCNKRTNPTVVNNVRRDQELLQLLALTNRAQRRRT